MASVNMAGRESHLATDMRNTVLQGGNVTHLMSVEVVNCSPEDANMIRLRVYQTIAHKAIFYSVRGMKFPITWRAPPTAAVEHYHCDGHILGDTAVIEHTKQLIKDVLSALDGEFDCVFSRGIVGVSFSVTKPLTSKRPLPSLKICF